MSQAHAKAASLRLCGQRMELPEELQPWMIHVPRFGKAQPVSRQGRNRVETRQL